MAEEIPKVEVIGRGFFNGRDLLPQGTVLDWDVAVYPWANVPPGENFKPLNRAAAKAQGPKALTKWDAEHKQ